jgi:hypothetical protein
MFIGIKCTAVARYRIATRQLTRISNGPTRIRSPGPASEFGEFGDDLRLANSPHTSQFGLVFLIHERLTPRIC